MRPVPVPCGGGPPPAARQVGPALRQERRLDESALLCGGLEPVQMNARSKQSVAEYPPLAQIPRPLRAVGLGRYPGRRHARDPDHVVGADLEAIQRFGYGGARAVEVPAAPALLAAQRAVEADPLRLLGREDERLGRIQGRLGGLQLTHCELLLGFSHVTDDQHHPAQPRRRWVEMGARFLPFTGFEGHFGDAEIHPAVGVNVPA